MPLLKNWAFNRTFSLEINVAGEETKGGFPYSDALEVIEQIDTCFPCGHSRVDDASAF